MSQQEEINKFLRSFRKNIQISLKATEKAINGSVFDLYKLLIDRTVVGDPPLWKSPAPSNYTPGKLKNSWRISFTGQVRDEPTGKFVSAQNIADMHGMTLKVNGQGTTKAMIWNPQPYLERIEYESWSTQAPSGFIRLSLLEFNHLVDSNVSKYKV